MQKPGFNSQKNILPTEPSTSALGSTGEKLAADYLRRRGYVLVALNFKVPVGRNRRGAQVTGEIDIVALDGETVCFIEVKTRSDKGLLGPLAAVDRRKRRQITRASKAYKRLFGLENTPHRFDAIGIVIRPRRAPTIEHRKAFWNNRVLKSD